MNSKKSAITFVLGATFYCVFASDSRSDNIFMFHSSPTSWVGQGQSYYSTNVIAGRFSDQSAYPKTLLFQSFQSGPGIEFNLYLRGPVSLTIPVGFTLPTVGYYGNAHRWPFYNGNSMDFSGQGRGNNMLTGWFNVLQADFNLDGSVAAYAVDFEQFDEDIPAWWNRGSVRYNSTIPVPEPLSEVIVLFTGCCLALYRNRDRR